MPRRIPKAKKQPTVAEVIQAQLAQIDLLVASVIRVIGVEKVKAESLALLADMAAEQKAKTKKAAKVG